MTQVTTRTVKTLAEKIADALAKVEAAQAQYDALVKQRDQEAALANVTQGYVVTFEQGRAETKRTVTATVLAPAYDVGGKLKVKAIAGEGASTELFEVEVAKLLSAEAPVVAEPEADAVDLLAIS